MKTSPDCVADPLGGEMRQAREGRGRREERQGGWRAAGGGTEIGYYFVPRIRETGSVSLIIFAH